MLKCVIHLPGYYFNGILPMTSSKRHYQIVCTHLGRCGQFYCACTRHLFSIKTI